MSQKITPFLWFDSQAEEAATFYTSVFPNSKMGKISHYPPEGEKVSGMKAGTVMVVEFELDGQRFNALNGGPVFKLTEAVSFVVDCKDQEEVDYYWNTLTADGGEESQCGWLKDKFGLSWQITPEILTSAMSDPDRKRYGRVMEAMLKMKKIIVADIEKAYEGK